MASKMKDDKSSQQMQNISAQQQSKHVQNQPQVPNLNLINIINQQQTRTESNENSSVQNTERSESANNFSKQLKIPSKTLSNVTSARQSQRLKCKLIGNPDLTEVHQSLIELYLDVKVRSNEEIVNLNDEQLEREQNKLMEVDTLSLIEYIKTSIEILLNLKMETSMSGSTYKRHRNNSNNRGHTDNSIQLNNSQLTNTSNVTTTTNGMRGEPPKAYEEIIQKLENDIRNHIRVEQQMKIAMEALQQKLEDKDKEKSKIKNEYKQYIHELKQDKKRYVELLELRDLEMTSLNDKVKKIDSMESDYKSKLKNLEDELNDYKTRERSPKQGKEQNSNAHNISKSLDRPSIQYATSRTSILLASQHPQMLQNSTSQSFLKKQSLFNQNYQNELNSSDFGRKTSHSNNQSLGRKSPDRVAQNISSNGLNMSQKIKKQMQGNNSNNTSQIKTSSVELAKQKNDQNNLKKQSFLTQNNNQLQKMIQSSSQNEFQNHKKSNSSNMTNTQNLNTLKGIKLKKSQERQQPQTQIPTSRSTIQQKQNSQNNTNANVNLAHTQSLQAIKKNIQMQQKQPITMNLLTVNSKLFQNNTNSNNYETYKDSNQNENINIYDGHNESFGNTAKQSVLGSMQDIQIISQDLQSNKVPFKQQSENISIVKSRGNSSCNVSSATQLHNTQRLRSKENAQTLPSQSQGSKLISSKRQAASNFCSNNYDNSRLGNTLNLNSQTSLHDKIQATQMAYADLTETNNSHRNSSRGGNSRLLTSSCSISNLQSSSNNNKDSQLNKVTNGATTNTLYAKLFLTNRK